jgi:hypothetical protein
MAKVVIVLEDKDNGELDVKFTCDTPLPEDYNNMTLSQLLSAQLHEVVTKLFSEQAPNV